MSEENDAALAGAETAADTAENTSLTALQQLPVRLDCVLASTELTLEQLQGLRTGSALPLPPIALNDIKLYCNQKLCGTAKLVAIENTYVLQISSLLGRRQQPASETATAATQTQPEASVYGQGNGAANGDTTFAEPAMPVED